LWVEIKAVLDNKGSNNNNNTQNTRHTTQFFSPPNDQLCSLSRSSNCGTCRTQRFLSPAILHLYTEHDV